ncbi:hypothetical protein [Ulvibacterium marinum]|uniref:Beta-mannosidase Ig-fold domain-containing protein n=1 Tax=Ulvibacterium marinum TaxID=2419782 RepID=A0A3B0BUC0_9FLAO|nr:hypothetical protein [Ulvibacterium marinum]RKN77013.1 hypothetical protein D7Z94_24880 [Ulvibacterium marinum]
MINTLKMKDGDDKLVSETRTNLLESGKSEGAISNVKIKVEDTGKHPAFMTQLNVKGGKRLFRVSYNFFWMEPREQKTISLEINWREMAPKKAFVTEGLWNSKTVKHKL